MAEKIEEQYLDVLQNIEFALVSVYNQEPKLTDYGSLYAVETLIKVYTAELQGRTVALPQFQPHEQAAYDAVKSMCDWWLGRETLENAEDKGELKMDNPRTPEEIIACLKRIQRSIQGWQKRGGRRGYYEFVKQYIT